MITIIKRCFESLQKGFQMDPFHEAINLSTIHRPETNIEMEVFHHYFLEHFQTGKPWISTVFSMFTGGSFPFISPIFVD